MVTHHLQIDLDEVIKDPNGVPVQIPENVFDPDRGENGEVTQVAVDLTMRRACLVALNAFRVRVDLQRPGTLEASEEAALKCYALGIRLMEDDALQKYLVASKEELDWLAKGTVISGRFGTHPTGAILHRLRNPVKVDLQPVGREKTGTVTTDAGKGSISDDIARVRHKDGGWTDAHGIEYGPDGTPRLPATAPISGIKNLDHPDNQ